jgi:hypothetical protein
MTAALREFSQLSVIAPLFIVYSPSMSMLRNPRGLTMSLLLRRHEAASKKRSVAGVAHCAAYGVTK